MTIDPKDLGSRAESWYSDERIAAVKRALRADLSIRDDGLPFMKRAEKYWTKDGREFSNVGDALLHNETLRALAVLDALEVPPAPVVPSNLEDKDLGKEGSS